MYWFFGITIVIYLIYKISNNGIRKATKIIGYQINVKPALVTECISKMRTDPNMALGKMTRKQYFCYLASSSLGNQSELNDPIKIFYIYQIIRNQNENNISWWAEKVSSAGFEVTISLHEEELFQSFFDIDWQVLKIFIKDHNTKFI